MATVVRTKEEVRKLVAAARAEGRQIGFVPTMGALHVGHRTLMEQAVAENGFTVLSVFVNPAQFGPSEDFDAYPRQLEADATLAGAAGVNVVFAPRPDEMYAADHSTWVEEESLSEGLCGARRPGHFRGVATVCVKLFNIVRPDRAYFGRKDYQQLQVIRRMVRDLDLPLEIRSVATARDLDGLAVSSRNQYLSPQERQSALAIWRSLKQAAALITGGEKSPRAVSDAVRGEIVREGLLHVEYIEIVDAETLEPAAPLEGATLVAVAVHCGRTRLIDNIVVNAPGTA